MQINRSTTEDRTIWILLIDDDTEIASLEVWTANGEIANVKTSHPYQRMGYAHALYRRAQSDFDGGIFHTVYTHRTPDGDAFAHAVGGDTIESSAAHVEKNCGCTYCNI